MRYTDFFQKIFLQKTDYSILSIEKHISTITLIYNIMYLLYIVFFIKIIFY